MPRELADIQPRLDETQRTILELAMQNYSVEEIAEGARWSKRIVQRTLQQVRKELEEIDAKQFQPQFSTVDRALDVGMLWAENV